MLRGPWADSSVGWHVGRPPCSAWGHRGFLTSTCVGGAWRAAGAHAKLESPRRPWKQSKRGNLPSPEKGWGPVTHTFCGAVCEWKECTTRDVSVGLDPGGISPRRVLRKLWLLTFCKSPVAWFIYCIADINLESIVYWLLVNYVLFINQEIKFCCWLDLKHVNWIVFPWDSWHLYE